MPQALGPKAFNSFLLSSWPSRAFRLWYRGLRRLLLRSAAAGLAALDDDSDDAGPSPAPACAPKIPAAPGALPLYAAPVAQEPSVHRLGHARAPTFLTPERWADVNNRPWPKAPVAVLVKTGVIPPMVHEGIIEKATGPTTATPIVGPSCALTQRLRMLAVPTPKAGGHVKACWGLSRRHCQASGPPRGRGRLEAGHQAALASPPLWPWPALRCRSLDAPSHRERALGELDRDILAHTTQSPSFRIRTWELVTRGWDLEPWPVTFESLRAFAPSMKALRGAVLLRGPHPAGATRHADH